MPDILSVSLQDFLYRRKSELRKGEISFLSLTGSYLTENRIMIISSDFCRCLLCVKQSGRKLNVMEGIKKWYISIRITGIILFLM